MTRLTESDIRRMYYTPAGSSHDAKRKPIKPAKGPDRDREREFVDHLTATTHKAMADAGRILADAYISLDCVLNDVPLIWRRKEYGALRYVSRRDPGLLSRLRSALDTCTAEGVDVRCMRPMPGSVADLLDDLREEFAPAPDVWVLPDGRMFVGWPDLYTDGFCSDWRGPYLTDVEVIAELTTIADELRMQIAEEGAALNAKQMAKVEDDDDLDLDGPRENPFAAEQAEEAAEQADGFARDLADEERVERLQAERDAS